MTQWQIEMHSVLRIAVREYNRASDAWVKEVLRLQIQKICEDLGIEMPKPRLPADATKEITP
jgi:hypothetical protein